MGRLEGAVKVRREGEEVARRADRHDIRHVAGGQRDRTTRADEVLHAADSELIQERVSQTSGKADAAESTAQATASSAEVASVLLAQVFAEVLTQAAAESTAFATARAARVTDSRVMRTTNGPAGVEPPQAFAGTTGLAASAQEASTMTFTIAIATERRGDGLGRGEPLGGGNNLGGRPTQDSLGNTRTAESALADSTLMMVAQQAAATTTLVGMATQTMAKGASAEKAPAQAVVLIQQPKATAASTTQTTTRATRVTVEAAGTVTRAAAFALAEAAKLAQVASKQPSRGVDATNRILYVMAVGDRRSVVNAAGPVVLSQGLPGNRVAKVEQPAGLRRARREEA